MKQETLFSNFYKRKLLNNETTLSYSTLANYYANMKIKETIRASPKWGKRGVGAFMPLALYYLLQCS